MRRVSRWLLGIAGLLLAVTVIALVAGILWLRTSLPELDGEVAVAQLSHPVEILRDQLGVPTIHADSPADAAFGLGFVHAQDRFSQMELMRRSGAGRLSEILGRRSRATDRYLRGLGFYARARAQADNLPGDLEAVMQAYADGVNAWLQHHRGALPWELALTLHTPEPWTIADSLVWGRLMAFTLTTNWRREAIRARMASRLTRAQLRDLWPDAANLDSGLTPMTGGGGSNVWAVAPDAVLANDPHLGLTIPNIWYLARIETPDGIMAGATTPGMPLLVLGHNGSIAWGMTTSYTDTTDLVRQSTVISTRNETIRLRDDGAEQFRVRQTRRGIILSDISARSGDGWALEGPLFDRDDRTALALHQLNRSRTVGDALAALRDFHTPSQNVVIADTAGHIGLVSAGRIPQRPGPTGFFVSDNLTWDDYIPFDSLPMLRDPPNGRVINANNAVIGDDYPYHIGSGWAAPFRAKRIETMLDDGRTHEEIQNDTVSLAARALLPHLLEAVDEPALAGWDAAMDRNRPEPVLYMAWVRAAMQTVFADELGDHFEDWWSYRPLALLNALTRRPSWCDDIETPETETCAARLAAAHERALAHLTDRHGPTIPSWGEVHKARFAHPIAGSIPILRDLVDREIATDGGPDTVNAGKMDFRDNDHPFRQVHGAGYRAIYQLDDLGRSRFIQAVGQSGNPFSLHYDDLMTLWRNGDYIALIAPVDPTHRLVLRPL